MSTQRQRIPSPLDTLSDPVLKMLREAGGNKKSNGGSGSVKAGGSSLSAETAAPLKPEDTVGSTSASLSGGGPPALRPSAAAVAEEQTSSPTLTAQAKKYDRLKESDALVMVLAPERVGHAPYKNRSDRSLSEDDPKFKEILESIRDNGQDDPITVCAWPGEGPHPHEYMLLAGRRRHKACTVLGIPVIALIRTVASEMDAVLLMYRENAERADLSPIETGRMFQDWLDRGLFGNQVAVAAKVNRDKSVVNRYFRLANLPDVVTAAFPDEREIALRWVDDIQAALTANRVAVEACAETLKQKKVLKAEEIFEALCTAGLQTTAGQRPVRRSHTLRQQSIKVNGRVPLKISFGKERVAFQTQHMEPEQVKVFVNEVAQFAEQVVRKMLEPKGEGET